MVTTEVWVILVPHLPQRSGHGSAAMGEERPDQKDQNSLPGSFLETATKGGKPGHEHGGQGHPSPPEASFSLKCSWCPCFLYRGAFCTKPRDLAALKAESFR